MQVKGHQSDKAVLRCEVLPELQCKQFPVAPFTNMV